MLHARLSELVNSLKGESSRRLQFPAIKEFWSVRKSRGVLWTPRYFARSVSGAPLSILKQSIETEPLAEDGRVAAQLTKNHP
jgi:putative transposase